MGAEPGPDSLKPVPSTTTRPSPRSGGYRAALNLGRLGASQAVVGQPVPPGAFFKGSVQASWAASSLSYCGPKFLPRNQGGVSVLFELLGNNHFLGPEHSRSAAAPTQRAHFTRCPAPSRPFPEVAWFGHEGASNRDSSAHPVASVRCRRKERKGAPVRMGVGR